jgi:hypothetical protein
MAESAIVSDHILEIRFEPMGAFLEKRGEVADAVKENGQFKHWSITSNRVDFWNEEKREDDPESGFISFRNCGYQVHNPPTRNYFPERAGRFLKSVEENARIKIPPVSRIGVRARFLCGSVLGFDEIRDRFYRSFYGNLDSGLFDGLVEDVGATLNFRRDSLYFNTSSGPMMKDQATTLIRSVKEEEFPASGLFLDIDCFLRDLGKQDLSRITREVRELHDECWVRLDKLKELIRV